MIGTPSQPMKWKDRMLKPDTLTMTQIIDAFPDECRELIPKVNKTLKSQLKPYESHCKSIRYRHYDQFTEIFLLQVMRMEYKPGVIEKQIKRNNGILDALDGPKEGKINDAMIEQAKEVPLATLYDFEKIRSGHMRYAARCPFHSEKDGSFTVYPNNTYYCFGCHEGGDAIEFVRKLHGFQFPEAVKFLINQ